MTVPARLAAFALAVTIAVAGGAALGAGVGPIDDPTPPPGTHGTHGTHGLHRTDAGPGSGWAPSATSSATPSVAGAPAGRAAAHLR